MDRIISSSPWPKLFANNVCVMRRWKSNVLASTLENTTREQTKHTQTWAHRFICKRNIRCRRGVRKQRLVFSNDIHGWRSIHFCCTHFWTLHFSVAAMSGYISVCRRCVIGEHSATSGYLVWGPRIANQNIVRRVIAPAITSQHFLSESYPSSPNIIVGLWLGGVYMA